MLELQAAHTGVFSGLHACEQRSVPFSQSDDALVEILRKKLAETPHAAAVFGRVGQPALPPERPQTPCVGTEPVVAHLEQVAAFRTLKSSEIPLQRLTAFVIAALQLHISRQKS